MALRGLLYLFAGLTKAAFALLVIKNGFAEVFVTEIGPIGVAKIQLAVGTLPKQEIAQSLFAACADEELWIGNTCCGKMVVEVLLGDCIGIAFALNGFARYLSHDFGEFPF